MPDCVSREPGRCLAPSLRLAEKFVEALGVNMQVKHRGAEVSQNFITLSCGARPRLQSADEINNDLALLAQRPQECFSSARKRPDRFRLRRLHRVLPCRRRARAIPNSNALISRSQYAMSPSSGKLFLRSA